MQSSALALEMISWSLLMNGALPLDVASLLIASGGKALPAPVLEALDDASCPGVAFFSLEGRDYLS